MSAGRRRRKRRRRWKRSKRRRRRRRKERHRRMGIGESLDTHVLGPVGWERMTEDVTRKN